MIEEIKKELEVTMVKALDSLKYQLSKVRTGRASSSILDGIQVNYYGNPTPLKQVGQISTPEARLLQIQPFDKSLIPDIEKAILGANIGLTPSNDGNLIRIPFPSLTEERRKEQIKDVKKLVEDARVAVRSYRREKNEEVKGLEKAKELSEDLSKVYQAEIQKITDFYVKKIDEIFKSKEEELFEV